MATEEEVREAVRRLTSREDYCNPKTMANILLWYGSRLPDRHRSAEEWEYSITNVLGPWCFGYALMDEVVINTETNSSWYCEGLLEEMPRELTYQTVVADFPYILPPRYFESLDVVLAYAGRSETEGLHGDGSEEADVELVARRLGMWQDQKWWWEWRDPLSERCPALLARARR